MEGGNCSNWKLWLCTADLVCVCVCVCVCACVCECVCVLTCEFYPLFLKNIE